MPGEEKMQEKISQIIATGTAGDYDLRKEVSPDTGGNGL